VPIALNGLGADDTGARSNEASQLGALTEIADTSFGVAALWIIALGLALYVVWRLISIALPAENSAKAWLTRVGYLVSAITYSILAWTALSFATHSRSGGQQSEDAKVERLSRDLMEHTAGRWLVGLAGVVVVSVGVYFFVKGVKASFRDELEPGGVGPLRHETIVTLGRIGWAGRGVVMGLVGWFVILAAVRAEPKQAQGFDGALRDATGSAIGALLVAFAAVALLVYGLFCVISAPRQRLVGAD
jgi:hypothetical protein